MFKENGRFLQKDSQPSPQFAHTEDIYYILELSV